MTYYLKSKKIALCLILVAISLLPVFSYAQQGTATEPNEEQISQNAISSLENDLSKPSVELDILSGGRIGQSVKVSAYTTNISKETSDFLWYIDDILDQGSSGKAKTELSFVTTKENHVVRLVIEQDHKKITENSILVNSYNIAMTWHADTYIPPEYPGKAMPIRNSDVTVTAIPDIRGYDPSELLYTWYIDGESRVRSVLGEQEFSLKITKNVSSLSVLVEVSNLSRSLTVSRAILIPVVRPTVVLYHARSDKEAATATAELSISPGASVNVTAKPFNFQASNISDFDYIWEFLGNQATGEKTDPELLTLSIPENSLLGDQDLHVKISNRRVFQEIAASILTVKIIQNQQ